MINHNGVLIRLAGWPAVGVLAAGLLACELASQQVIDPSSQQAVLQVLRSEMQRQTMDGLSFCVVKNDRLLWSGALGEADRQANTPATPATRFLAASVSKTIVAVAAMQLWEQGRFKLDDDINQYLPFPVLNPRFPDEKITFRMLMAHTSSISDDDYDTFNLYCFGFDCPTPLGEHLGNFFSPNGAHFSDKSFYTYPPGAKAAYFTNGIALLAYLVERIAQQPFDAYCQARIFQPLGMSQTSWRLADFPLKTLAIPYSPTVTRGNPHYTFPDYPDGGLRTSAEDLSRFLRMLIGEGRLGDVQILESATLRQMQIRQSTETQAGQTADYGLVLYYRTINGQEVFGHDGDEQGVTSLLFYNPATNVGVIILSNNMQRRLDLMAGALLNYGEKQ